MAKQLSHGNKRSLKQTSTDATRGVDMFLDALHARRDVEVVRAPAKLIFALDATMSRQPTWAIATEQQAEMFAAAQDVGGLNVQVMFFRGQGELRKSSWTTSPAQLADKMSKVTCRGGYTQIARVLRDVEHSARRDKVKALVYVGDAAEENPDLLCELAAQLALLGVKIFMFQEGDSPNVTALFKELARISGGAYGQFDHNSAGRLRALLRAVGAYTAGGLDRLRTLAKDDAEAAAVLKQLPGPRL
ncbi:MAG: VWA domain-containing protein [Pseudomonadota bacterium]